MRWMNVGLGLLLLLAILFVSSGCGLTEFKLQDEGQRITSVTNSSQGGPLTVHAQIAEAMETLGIQQLHEAGLSGQGVTLFLIAPFKEFRPGAEVPVGFYLTQIIQAIAPGAQIVPCDTGGDSFNIEPIQLSDCLLEALWQKPDIIVVGAMSWETFPSECDDLLDGRVTNSNLLIFAGAGDTSSEGLAYPACIPNVVPVLATYDATQSGNLPFLRNCWRNSIHKDELACFTNYLSDQTLLAAPGAIIQAKLFEVNIPYCCSTAISATIAGATTALFLEAYPSALPDQIFQAFRETGVPIKDVDGRTLGIRISAHRAYLWMKEQEELSLLPSPSPSPRQRTIQDFDLNRDCLIDSQELMAAMDAWVQGKIEEKLFLDVLDAWISQTNVCT